MTRWHDMVAKKLYLTGGVGSRHKSEAFGDPYELPADRAYCETCAAIGSIHWSWRLLLATGESKYADLIERTIYNGLGAAISIDGRSFFYSNPLQVRADHEASDEEESGRRLPWYRCACCPPNLMRAFASLPHYVATTTDAGLQLHQFTSASVRAELVSGEVELDISTDYPARRDRRHRRPPFGATTLGAQRSRSIMGGRRRAGVDRRSTRLARPERRPAISNSTGSGRLAIESSSSSRSRRGSPPEIRVSTAFVIASRSSTARSSTASRKSTTPAPTSPTCRSTRRSIRSLDRTTRCRCRRSSSPDPWPFGQPMPRSTSACTSNRKVVSSVVT